MTVRPRMTEQELELYRSGPKHWGDAEDYVARGAELLDTWMPGWAERVSLPDFDLSSPCDCVLGQLFRTPALMPARWDVQTGDHTESGYGSYSDGLNHLGLSSWEYATAPEDRDGDAISPDCFYGFDHSLKNNYEVLQTAWTAEIEMRRKADG